MRTELAVGQRRSLAAMNPAENAQSAEGAIRVLQRLIPGKD